MNSNQWINQVESELKELAEGTDRAKASEFFQEYLDAASRFWNYSFHNQLLIRSQFRQPTRVAGYRTWESMGRKVRKGEKGIRILAPATKRANEPADEYKEQKEEFVLYFFTVCVFDISQTEGKPLPELDIEIKGDDKACLLDRILGFCKERGILVDFKDLDQGWLGASMGRRIVIDEKLSVNSKVNTLLHEVAHELLHRDSDREGLSRQQKEIQAEGTAYVVSKALGIEAKSFDYLALYDADFKRIMENLQAIAEAAKLILKGLKAPCFF
ncbi:MAG: ArdC-like ssDNA-binding domain-containing protein [Nanoarchaeota archaeon]